MLGQVVRNTFRYVKLRVTNLAGLYEKVVQADSARSQSDTINVKTTRCP